MVRLGLLLALLVLPGRLGLLLGRRALLVLLVLRRVLLGCGAGWGGCGLRALAYLGCLRALAYLGCLRA